MADKTAAASQARRDKLAVPPALRTSYLVLYSSLAAAVWLTVCYRAVAIFANRGPRYVYAGTRFWTHVAAYGSGVDVLHSLLGLGQPLHFTVAVHTAARALILPAVADRWPLVALAPFYTSMIVGWGAADAIRHTFAALELLGVRPRPLAWVRYSNFYVLYPVAVLSECALIGMASQIVGLRSTFYMWVHYYALLIYGPGSFFLYTYLIKQRERALGISKAVEGPRTQKDRTAR